MRGRHRRVSKSNTCRGNERHSSVPVPPFGCVTGPSRTSPHHAGDQKTVKAEVRQQLCTIRKSGRLAQIQSDLNKSQLAYIFPSHRLSSRGGYVWETLGRGRFTAQSDGGRLFLNLFSSQRVGRVAQRLGVRAELWNLRYGERYDVTHLANLRRLLTDIADEAVQVA